jgi:cytochrome c
MMAPALLPASFLAVIPIPRDIQLPLPGDGVLLQALLVMAFLFHILFVNLMVGGSLIGLALEIRGRRDQDYDRLAYEIARTITVNKSLAVVLGVGPLLIINVYYTLYFYSANALTGTAWISIVPLVIAAFLVAYAHKYSWHRLDRARWLRLALGGLAALLFLCIPLIFLSNINLMLFPDRWPQVRGFLSALSLPNVLPRYLHFLLASVAIAALFMVGYFGRAAYPADKAYTRLDRPALRRLFYRIALAASLAQLVAGPLLLLTLPRVGLSWQLYAVIAVGACCGLAAMILMGQEVMASAARAQHRFLAVFALITLTAFVMGYGRHVYRENAVREHRQLMAERTREFSWAAGAALWRQATGLQKVELPLGQQIFENTCSACHAVDRVLVGPPVLEIARIYAGDPEGIVRWTSAPGRRRAGFPVMPAFKMGEQKLSAVAEYMLQVGADGT